MIEIIPNWHHIFVHFTVALFSTAVGFYSLSYVADKCHLAITKELASVSRWCLWTAACITLFTVIAGLQAYNTVAHDAPSHLAMTDHRNWALPTATVMVSLALWSVFRFRRQTPLSLIFLLSLFIGQGLVLSTAWRGAELVFRYGLGVQSLPQAEGKGHHHLSSSGAAMQGHAPAFEDGTSSPHDHSNKSH